MKNLLKLFLPLLIISPLSHAQLESWYAYSGFGSANYNDSPYNNLTNTNISRVKFTMDIFGAYWPVAQTTTIIGFQLGSSADAISNGYNINQLTYTATAASAMHFFGYEPGDGFFLRGDVGLVKGSYTEDSVLVAQSQFALHTLIGGGFGFPISENTRILANFNASFNRLDSGSTSVKTSVGLGFLW